MKQPWGTASLIARPAPTPTDGPPGVSTTINGSAGFVSSTHSGGGRDGAQYQWERAGRSQRTGMVSQGIGEYTEASTLVQEELCVFQKAHWTHHHIKSY